MNKQQECVQKYINMVNDIDIDLAMADRDERVDLLKKKSRYNNYIKQHETNGYCDFCSPYSYDSDTDDDLRSSATESCHSESSGISSNSQSVQETQLREIVPVQPNNILDEFKAYTANIMDNAIQSMTSQMSTLSVSMTNFVSSKLTETNNRIDELAYKFEQEQKTFDERVVGAIAPAVTDAIIQVQENTNEIDELKRRLTELESKPKRKPREANGHRATCIDPTGKCRGDDVLQCNKHMNCEACGIVLVTTNYKKHLRSQTHARNTLIIERDN